MAVKVVIPDVPPKFKVAAAACTSPPVPERAVVAVMVPLLVRLTEAPVTVRRVETVNTSSFKYEPVKVALGIEIIFKPLRVFVAPVKVCVPVLAVKVPSFWRFPAKLTAAAAVSFHDAPGLMVTLPVKGFVPVADEMASIPLVPSPIFVAPVTVKLKPAAVKVVPLPIFRSPPMVKLFAVVAVAVPLSVRLPVIVEIVPNVIGPPDNVRLLYEVTKAV